MDGDVFVVLFHVKPNMEDSIVDNTVHIAEKLQKVTVEPIVISDHIVNVSFSIGIELITAEAESGSVILRRANAAMFTAKTKGKNQIQFYES